MSNRIFSDIIKLQRNQQVFLTGSVRLKMPIKGCRQGIPCRKSFRRLGAAAGFIECSEALFLPHSKTDRIPNYIGDRATINFSNLKVDFFIAEQ